MISRRLVRNMPETNDMDVDAPSSAAEDWTDDMQSIVSTPAISTPSQHYSGLSELQQQKFKDYLDNELLSITRRFVKRAAEAEGSYKTLGPLLQDLNKLIDVVWYSISGKDDKDLFGQPYYLLRIADELVDFIAGFQHDPRPRETIQILKKLDNIFARMIDHDGVPKLRQTEAVRLDSIAERTRIVVTKAFEGIHDYDEEASKVYEEVLDRTG